MPQTLAHEDSYHTSLICRRLKQLNQGEAWGDHCEAFELLLESGEAQSRSCATVEDQELQAAAASPRGSFASPKVSKMRPLALLNHVGRSFVLPMPHSTWLSSFTTTRVICSRWCRSNREVSPGPLDLGWTIMIRTKITLHFNEIWTIDLGLNDPD
jgi:hypothetical protein